MTTLLPLVLGCAGNAVDLAAAGADGGGPARTPGDARPVDAPIGDPDWTVDCAGGADFKKIQDAVVAAESGDWIAVAPCTYAEQIDFGGKSLWIASTGSSADTEIDANGKGAVVTADHGEGDGTAIVGFTLSGGSGYGAVYASLTALRLDDVVIADSSGYAGIWGDSADVELEHVRFDGGTASYGRIVADRGSLVANDVEASCKGGGAALYLGHANAFIDHSTFTCLQTWAVEDYHTGGKILRTVMNGGLTMEQEEDHSEDTIRLENVVVAGSISQTFGSFQFRNSIALAGVTLTTVGASTAIEGSVLSGGDCGIAADTADFTVRNTVFWDNVTDACNGAEYVGADGNLHADPLFVDPGTGDYSLKAASPLVDAGPEDAGWEDPDGSRNDIGAYGGPHTLAGGY